MPNNESDEPMAPENEHANKSEPKKTPDKKYLDSLVNLNNARKLLVHGIDKKASEINSFEFRDHCNSILGHPVKNAYIIKKQETGAS